MPRHNGTMTCLLGRSRLWGFQVITLRHGPLLRGSERKHAEDVEDSGSELGAGGSQWKLWKTSGSGGRHVGDKKGVGRGAGGAGEVQEVWKRFGRGLEGHGKVQKRWEGTGSNGTLQAVLLQF